MLTGEEKVADPQNLKKQNSLSSDPILLSPRWGSKGKQYMSREQGQAKKDILLTGLLTQDSPGELAWTISTLDRGTVLKCSRTSVSPGEVWFCSELQFQVSSQTYFQGWGPGFRILNSMAYWHVFSCPITTGIRGPLIWVGRCKASNVLKLACTSSQKLTGIFRNFANPYQKLII